MDFLTFLNAKNYQTYNRKLALKIGLEASIFLSEIVDKYQYFNDQNKLIDGEWFYLSIEDVYERTVLTRWHQDSAIKKLKELKIIEVKIKGCPATRHFRLDVPKLLEFLSLSFPANWFANSSNLDCKNSQTAPIYKEPKEEPKEEYIPPNPLKGEAPQAVRYGKFVALTKEEFDSLRQLYGSTKALSEMISQMNDHLSASGKKPYKDFAAALRNWFRKRENDQKNLESRLKGSSWKKNKYPTTSNDFKPTSSDSVTPEPASQEWSCLGDILNSCWSG